MSVLEAPLLWFTIVAPTFIAILFQATVLGSLGPRVLAYVSSAILAIPLFLLAYKWLWGYNVLVDPLKLDLSRYNVGVIALVVDGFSAPLVVGVSLVTSLVAIYSLKYMEHRIWELEHGGLKVPGIYAYYILYNAFSSSMLGMLYSTNLISFFVFLELSLITSFLLIAYYGYGERLRIALMYFVWTHIGGALFLAGILFYGVNAGTFDILTVKEWALEYNKVYAGVKVEGLALIAPLLIILGLLVKMAVFGVHMWLPYAHAEAPTPVSALLSPNLIGIAGYALARFGLTLFPGFMESAKHYLVLIAFITIIYGGLVALRQDDFKRFLAYSSISQMGYILLGVSTLTTFGVAGAMLHYLSHAVGKAVLFMIAGVFIAEISGLRSISAMGGLARLYPTTAAMALIGFMHLVGMPPAFGMWSEMLILLGLSEAYYPGSLYDILLIAVAVIASFIVTAFYSFIAMRRIFFGRPKRGSPLEVMDEFKVSILIIALAGIILFLVVGLMIPQLRDSSLELLALGGLR